ncbi:MAG: endo-1,3-alpha-glucanase family glycosylhydrolase [Acidobacteriaceae bacterium]
MKYTAAGNSPELLAVYEAWFGHPQHISISYSSHDSAVIQRQIQQAQKMGISAFVVDWYGSREPFIDKSYALMQKAAGEQHFHIAMMYDESHQEDGATDDTIADLKSFHDTYLSPTAPGHQAYLTYKGRPVIFIFPTTGHTNWDQVRKVVDKWKPAPFLINENLPGRYSDAIDGGYAWVNPGPKGWAPNGSNWGKGYLSNFYQTMVSKYPDKIIVGGAWAQFNDAKAHWGLNRHISGRCGQTFQDTLDFWRKYVPANQPIPFILIGTWNDYEEGTAIEAGIPSCGNNVLQLSNGKLVSSTANTQGKTRSGDHQTASLGPKSHATR